MEKILGYSDSKVANPKPMGPSVFQYVAKVVKKMGKGKGSGRGRGLTDWVID